ncbi:hypothetical protein MAP00_000864 [Monascus purpureus]|nr:hypothetical protein MAP00_000864 [Monascus purpureus]
MSAKTSKTINYTDTKFVTETGDEKCGFELRVVDMPTKVPAEALVPNTNWKSPPLPTIDDKLTMPKPDLTVGYRYTYIKAYKAILDLVPFLHLLSVSQD